MKNCYAIFLVCVYVIKIEGLCAESLVLQKEQRETGEQQGEERKVLRIFYQTEDLDFYLSCICDVKAEKLGYYDGT